MSKTIEQYLEQATEDFAMQYFETFYLDVIHRNYTLHQFLYDDNNLFNQVVDTTASYDFIELRKILNVARSEAVQTGGAIIADKIREPFRERVEARLIELLEDRREEIIEDLKNSEKDELTKRDIRTFTQYKENLTHAIEDYRKQKNELSMSQKNRT